MKLLTDEDLQDIQDDAQIGKSFREIALRLGISLSEFIDMYYNPDSVVKQYFDKGQQMGITEINNVTFNLAKNGSAAGQAAYQKLIMQSTYRNTLDSISEL